MFFKNYKLESQKIILSVTLSNLYKFTKKIKNNQNKDFNAFYNPIALVEQGCNYYQKKFTNTIFFNFSRASYKSIFKYSILKFKLFKKKLMTDLYISDNFLVKNLEFVRYRMFSNKSKFIDFKKLIKIFSLNVNFKRKRRQWLSTIGYKNRYKVRKSKWFIIRKSLPGTILNGLYRRKAFRSCQKRLSKKKKDYLNTFNTINAKKSKSLKKKTILKLTKLWKYKRPKAFKRTIKNYYNQNKKLNEKEKKFNKLILEKIFFYRSKRNAFWSNLNIITSKYKRYFMSYGTKSIFDYIPFKSLKSLKHPIYIAEYCKNDDDEKLRKMLVKNVQAQRNSYRKNLRRKKKWYFNKKINKNK